MLTLHNSGDRASLPHDIPAGAVPPPYRVFRVTARVRRQPEPLAPQPAHEQQYRDDGEPRRQADPDAAAVEAEPEGQHARRAAGRCPNSRSPHRSSAPWCRAGRAACRRPPPARRRRPGTAPRRPGRSRRARSPPALSGSLDVDEGADQQLRHATITSAISAMKRDADHEGRPAGAADAFRSPAP